MNLTSEILRERDGEGLAVEYRVAGSSESAETEWEEISFAQSAGTSDHVRTYAYRDGALPDAARLEYRLRHVNSGNVATYSSAITVQALPRRRSCDAICSCAR